MELVLYVILYLFLTALVLLVILVLCIAWALEQVEWCEHDCGQPNPLDDLPPD